MKVNYYDKKIECMPRNELKALQGERLKEVVKRVYERVPMYRAKIDAIGIKPEDIKSIDDIVKLPLTTKQDLRDNYPFGMFATDKKNIVRIHASSGTTGKLTVVGYTQKDIDIWTEMVARSLIAMGVTNLSTVHVAFGYGLFTGGLGLHYGIEKIGATVVPASSGNTQRQLTLMNDFEADVLCCTPSYAIHLADEIKKNNLKLPHLKIGVFGAEPWTKEMRESIEKSFGIDAYDIYGLSEITGPGVSSDCVYKDGMHINEDYFYPEIIDGDTLQPLKQGETGELVFTTLSKEGIPLIRYRTRDITKLNYEVCQCGRTFVRMEKVFGRNDDMLIIRGANVFPSQIEAVIVDASGKVEPHYHIIVDRINNLDVLEVQIEMSPNLFSDEISKIEQVRKQIEFNMQSMLGLRAKITLVSPNSLPRSEGKINRVTDRRKL